MSCGIPFEPQHITGHMVQAGSVAIGRWSEKSDAPDWDFDITVGDGPNDLVAVTSGSSASGAIAIRRGISLSGAVSLALPMPIDVAQEGVSLVAAPITVQGAAVGEDVFGITMLHTAHTVSNAPLYLGGAAVVQVAPNSVLLPTDTQLVLIEGSLPSSFRELRRPFRVGDDNVFALPDSLTGLVWTVDAGQISLAWAALPTADSMTLSVRGTSADMTSAPEYDLTASGRFLSATADKLTLVTDIAGFQPSWRIDFGQAYVRSALVEHTDGDAQMTSGTDVETVQPAGSAAPPRTIRQGPLVRADARRHSVTRGR
jgi:hypothetical protein